MSFFARIGGWIRGWIVGFLVGTVLGIAAASFLRPSDVGQRLTTIETSLTEVAESVSLLEAEFSDSQVSIGDFHAETDRRLGNVEEAVKALQCRIQRLKAQTNARFNAVEQLIIRLSSQ